MTQYQRNDYEDEALHLSETLCHGLGADRVPEVVEISDLLATADGQVEALSHGLTDFEDLVIEDEPGPDAFEYIDSVPDNVTAFPAPRARERSEQPLKHAKAA